MNTLVPRTWRRPLATALAAALCAPSWAQTPAPPRPDSLPGAGAAASDNGRGTPYIVEKSANICGIDTPRAISNPAKVDYPALLAATPEVRKLKKKKIDPESARGTQLMAVARRKVLAACEAVRASRGHCSVWKVIERRDRRPVQDITDRAKALIKG